MKIYFLVLLVQLVPTMCMENLPIKDYKLSIPLVRQKSPTEQYINAPYVSSFKGRFEEFHMKPHHNNRTNDSIKLYHYLDNEFYGEIVIGHPGQKFKVSFDTSWSLSWIMSSKCNPYTTPGCGPHNRYDHTKSSEYKPDGRPYFANEESFNLTGFYSYENISIAHSNVTGQSFVEMVTVPESFSLIKADGILGLGLKHDNYTPFFYTLLKQNKIKNPVFSLFLNRDRQSKKGGSISLGFIEKRHIHKTNNISEDIKYMPVESGKYWKFSMDEVILDLKNAKHEAIFFCKNGCKAIVDSSTNSIIGPIEDVNKIHDIIKATETKVHKYSVDCDTINKLPKIVYVIGGQNFTLQGRDFIIKMSQGPVTVCYSAFLPSSADDSLWVLGGAFLSEYFSVYHVDTKQIGFVKAA